MPKVARRCFFMSLLVFVFWASGCQSGREELLKSTRETNRDQDPGEAGVVRQADDSPASQGSGGMSGGEAQGSGGMSGGETQGSDGISVGETQGADGLSAGEVQSRGGELAAGEQAGDYGMAQTAPFEATEEIYVDVCGEVLRPGVYCLPAGSRIYQAVEAAGGLGRDAAASYLNQAAVLEDGEQIYVPSIWEMQTPDLLPSSSGKVLSSAQDVFRDMGGALAGAGSGEASGQSTGGQETAGQDGAGLEVSGQGADGQSALSGQAQGQPVSGGEHGHDGKVNLNTADLAALQTLTGIGEVRAQAILAYREAHGGFSRIEDIMQVSGIKQGTYEKIKEQITVE